MKLYCRYCKFYTTMDYDIHSHNFICPKCYKLLVGCNGYEILEFDDAGDLELYVTKDMFMGVWKTRKSGIRKRNRNPEPEPEPEPESGIRNK